MNIFLFFGKNTSSDLAKILGVNEVKLSITERETLHRMIAMMPEKAAAAEKRVSSERNVRIMKVEDDITADMVTTIAVMSDDSFHMLCSVSEEVMKSAMEVVRDAQVGYIDEILTNIKNTVDTNLGFDLFRNISITKERVIVDGSFNNRSVDYLMTEISETFKQNYSITNNCMVKNV